MWLRDGNVWRWDTVPELEVRPCRMEDGTAWWVCWFEGAACLAVEAAKASEAVKLHGGLTYDGHAKTGPVLPVSRSATAATGAARAGGVAEKPGRQLAATGAGRAKAYPAGAGQQEPGRGVARGQAPMR